jgi:Bacterial collagen, middle region
MHATADHEEQTMSDRRRVSIHFIPAPSLRPRAPIAALIAACVLAACGSDGVSVPAGLSGNNSGGEVTPTNPPSPPTANTTGTITTAGKVATDLGGTISALPVPGVSPGVTGSVGGTVGALGPVIDSTAQALSDGLGQTGATANPVGTTAAKLGVPVSATSGVIAGVAKTVDALGTGPLSPLAPVTTPVSGALYTAANGVQAGGMILGNTLASSPVQQVTQPVSNAITPLVITLGQTTQAIGTTSGLGQPVSGVLAQVGNALQGAGRTIGSSSKEPLVGDIGQLVSVLGNSVTNAGGLVNPNGPNGAAPIPGLITSLAGSTNTSVVAGAGSGGAGSPLAGLTGSLSGVTAGASGGTNPLSAATGALTSVTGALSSAPGGTAAGAGSGAAGMGSLLGNGLPVLGKLQ